MELRERLAEAITSHYRQLADRDGRIVPAAMLDDLERVVAEHTAEVIGSITSEHPAGSSRSHRKSTE